jgi:hypothetical protein
VRADTNLNDTKVVIAYRTKTLNSGKSSSTGGTYPLPRLPGSPDQPTEPPWLLALRTAYWAADMGRMVTVTSALGLQDAIICSGDFYLVP